MRASRLFALLLIGASSCHAADAPKHVSDKTAQYARPFPIVMVSENADQYVQSAARDVAAALGIKMIGRAKENPTCCVWLEVTNWTPSPGKPGFVIVNQPGGSILSASNREQFANAVAAFKASIRVAQDGAPEVPQGLMTNYPVVPIR